MNIKKALQILNLEPDVCLEDAKKAYRMLAKKYHPDRNGRNSDIQKDSYAKMSDINLAFKTLSPHLKKKSEKHTFKPKTNFKTTFQTDPGTGKTPESKKKFRAAGKNKKFSWIKAAKRWGDFFKKDDTNKTAKSSPPNLSHKNKTPRPKIRKRTFKKNLKFDEILKKIHPETAGEIKKTGPKSKPSNSDPYHRYQKFMAIKKKVKAMNSNRSRDMAVGKIQKISPVKPVMRIK